MLLVMVITIQYSCNFIKSPSEEVLKEEVKQSIDLTTIDKFPLFDTCKTTEGDTLAEKACFIQTLRLHVSKDLAQEELIFESAVAEELTVVVHISEEGVPTISSYEMNKKADSLVPNLRLILEQSIKDLPTIYPAYKKLPSGVEVPVDIQFSIPIKIVTKDTID